MRYCSLHVARLEVPVVHKLMDEAMHNTDGWYLLFLALSVKQYVICRHCLLVQVSYHKNELAEVFLPTICVISYHQLVQIQFQGPVEMFHYSQFGFE